eukprot:2627351-Amphidinium_carterae.1
MLKNVDRSRRETFLRPAEECSSLHSELSHFRSHAALQIQQIGLRQSISALEVAKCQCIAC